MRNCGQTFSIDAVDTMVDQGDADERQMGTELSVGVSQPS